MYQVYILESLKNGSYYIGYTANLAVRLKRHNLGHGKYTRRNLPYKIVWSETYATRSEAMRREKEMKSYKGGEEFKKLLKQ